MKLKYWIGATIGGLYIGVSALDANQMDIFTIIGAALIPFALFVGIFKFVSWIRDRKENKLAEAA